MEQDDNKIDPENQATAATELPGWLFWIGFVLGVSYPVLAFSIGFRAVYRLCCKPDVVNFLPPALSALTALFYLVATIGFARRWRAAWWISVMSLAVETALTLLVGSLSLTSAYAEVIGNTAWRAFGADYGFVPLIQPILGLIWLLHPTTRVAYGITAPTEPPSDDDPAIIKQ